MFIDGRSAVMRVCFPGPMVATMQPHIACVLFSQVDIGRLPVGR